MKRWMGSIGLLMMIGISVFMVANNCIILQSDGYSLDYILKKIFLYYSKLETEYSTFNLMNVISYFGSLLFGYIFLMQGFFRASKKYRIMLLIRFQKRNLFIRNFIIVGVVKSFIIVSVFAVFLWIPVFWHWRGFLYSDMEFVHFILRIVNLFLFFNVMTMVTLLGYFFLDGGKTLFLSGCIIGFLLIFNLFLPFISILTYGKTLGIEGLSIVIQIFVYGILGIVVNQVSSFVEW